MPFLSPGVGPFQEMPQMLVAIYVGGAPGFCITKFAISSGGSIVMIPRHGNVHVLVLAHKELWCTIVQLLVFNQTYTWSAVFFLQHLLGRLDVNGWAELSFDPSSPNLHT